jgi:transposase
MWRKYDDEFKRQAVKKVIDGQSVVSAAQELGINESLIHKWKRAALEKGDGSLSGAELSRELELKKRIRELEMENEILKKAALIFGRGS